MAGCRYRTRRRAPSRAVPKSLILVATDLGVLEATTSGGFRAIHQGLAGTGRISATGPWAREVAKRYRGEDMGIELTLTSSHPTFKLRPLTQAPTLNGGEGCFPSSIDDLVAHADAEEVYAECRAQIERIILWGISASNVSVRDGSAWYRPDLFDAVADLAEEFRLALAITPAASESRLGYDAYGLATARGVATIAQVIAAEEDLLATPSALIAFLEEWAPGAPEGITELPVAFSEDTPELRAYSERPEVYAAPLDLDIAEVRRLLGTHGIRLSSYRASTSPEINLPAR